MKAKRMLSLVMAAVLALCVLAGCRGGRTLSQVMAGLLEGQYQNVEVETDPDLEAALRAAVREGGELADILARLKQELGLGGGTLTLRGLSGGSISASGKDARAGGVVGDNNGEIIEQG